MFVLKSKYKELKLKNEALVSENEKFEKEIKTLRATTVMLQEELSGEHIRTDFCKVCKHSVEVDSQYGRYKCSFECRCEDFEK